MRRKKIIISLLLVSTLIIFAYIRREIFFQQAKELIKQNLEKNLLPVQLSIGKMEPRLFYGLVLENLEVTFPQHPSGLAVNIKVDEAFIDYNLWKNLFLGQKDVQQLRLVSPTINLSYPVLSADEETLRSRKSGVYQQKKTAAERGLADFVLFLEGGRIAFGGAQTVLEDLHGRLLLTQKGLYFQDLRATFKDNPADTLKVYGKLTAERLTLVANLEHLKINDFDILTNLGLTLNKKLKVPQDESPKISGTLRTYGSVFNHQPFPELSSSFEIQDGKLRILTLSLEDNYDLRGIVSLSPPFDCDLSLNFYQAAPHELFSQFIQSLDTEDGLAFLEEPHFAGLINGLLKITGPLDHPKIEGYLEAKDGYIGDLDFVSADINIKGCYPKISIVDSRIRREEDSFLMEGEIDLTKLEKQNFCDIRFKADKSMFWQGWDITRPDEDQIHMSKSVADDFKVTFDTFIDDEGRGYDSNYTNELGLECKIFGDKLLKLRLKKDEGTLGLERRISF